MNTALATLALLVVSTPALAGSAVGLAYEAPEGCPGQQEFVAAVAARGADFDGAGTAAAHRVMVVAIRKRDDGFAGAFQVRDDQTATNKREVHGPNCTEVVDALAVVTAIALRPEVATTQDPPAAAAAPGQAHPSEAREKTATPENERLHASTMIYHHTHESVVVGPGRLSFDLARTISLYAGVFSGAAPSTPMPRFDLSMLTANFVTTPDGAQRIVGPMIRSRVSLLGPATYQSIDTRTDLLGISFAMGLCLTPHYDSTGLVLLFCTEVGVGAMNLQTAASDGTLIQSKTVGFGSIGLGVEAQYHLGSLLDVGVKVGWDGYLGSPPWSAERADGTRIFASSSNSGYALLGIGLRY